MIAKRLFMIFLNLGWPFLANVVFLREGKVWFALSSLVILLLFIGPNDLLFGVYLAENYTLTVIFFYFLLFLLSVYGAWGRMPEVSLSGSRVGLSILMFLIPTLGSYAVPVDRDWDEIHFSGLKPILEPGNIAISDRADIVRNGDLVIFNGMDDRKRLGFVVSDSITSYGVAGEFPAYCDDSSCYRLESICPLRKSEITQDVITPFDTRSGMLAVSNFDLTALNFKSEGEIYRYIVKDEAVTGKVVGIVQEPSLFSEVMPIDELISLNCKIGG